MTAPRNPGRGFLLTTLLLLGTRSTFAADPARLEFFEKKVRPVLIEQCYKCHNSRGKAQGGLKLDSRAGLLEGGETGPAIVPGKPGESLLLQAIRHEDDAPKMPRNGPRLPEAVVADLTRWVQDGAFDPRDKPPTDAEIAALSSWDAIRDQRKSWWSFQPVRRPDPPQVKNAGWSDHPIDRFILAMLERDAIEPAPVADRRTLIRRLSFALTGLPPTAAETDRFLADRSPKAYEDLVDRLLASPRFGERWARHWMDWYRYAESHGSEGDPTIPHAWRYRDYLIRALNADVPYDRLIREHVAGDLLPDPRINKELGINESALGTGQLRMVPHGYAPTDALDELVTFTDNQIDVLSKAVLGLTVSCARCHDHKFDPIGQKDFYALVGVLASTRPALITVDTPEKLNTGRAELERLRPRLRDELAKAWKASLESLPRRLEDPAIVTPAILEAATKDPGHALHVWARLSKARGADLSHEWQRLADESRRAHATSASQKPAWDLTRDDTGWFRHGNGLTGPAAKPGQLAILPQGDRLVQNVYQAGVFTNGLSLRHNGVLTSPRFKVESDAISVLVAGGAGARVRLVLENYPRATGLIYRADTLDNEEFFWLRWDTRYWKGDWAHIEVATAGDIPVEADTKSPYSWFGLRAVAFHGLDEVMWLPWRFPGQILEKPPESLAGLATRYASAVAAAIDAWQAGTVTDEQAGLLGFCARTGLLPNTAGASSAFAALGAEYRKEEARVPVPTRAPGVTDGTPFDQPLFVRGNHKKPADPVARRFLEVFNPSPYQTAGCGRPELAESLADLKNPLVSRVAVNRLWHHLLGRGLVATTDNFGRMGELPSHPELLDELAARFAEGHGSIKSMIRLIVTSRTFQLSGEPPPGAREKDPGNALLSHFPLRRLEAEAVRDAILATSGQLDLTMYGPEVPGETPRRSVYVRVKRNELDPFLHTFDAPEPVSTRGRRDETNVPAQSLTLLNDPWVRLQGRRWAEALARGTATDAPATIDRVFQTAFNRPADAEETAGAIRFLADQEAARARLRQTAAQLDNDLARRRARVEAITNPVRARLAREEARPEAGADRPVPFALWEFNADLRDARGTLHAEAQSGARLENGSLVLDGQSYAMSAPLDRPLLAKTLEAWVVLDPAEQAGGGVISVETPETGIFDALVFGEISPRQWLAGSNVFSRTRPFDGPPEPADPSRPVHLAIVYSADGTIAGYRDGKAYGTPYRSSGPQRFEPGKSRVLFGLRHSPPGGNRHLRGRILRAAIHDRALSMNEVALSASASPAGYVSEREVLAALPAADRAEHDRLNAEIAALVRSRAALAPAEDLESSTTRRWQDLTQAVFNLKEFLYVR